MTGNRKASKWLQPILSFGKWCSPARDQIHQTNSVRHTTTPGVSLSPAGHAAVSIPPKQLAERKARSPAGLLQKACPEQWKKSGEILQSSFQSSSVRDIVPRRTNGFVETVLEAYNHHRALIIRPDDVWLAILTQFNFFVNGNAELLRSQFVAHEGKEHLVVRAIGNRYTVDFGHMAKQMATLIQENVVDPALHEWILPNFSTTTDNDRIVGAIVMMSTLKAYFSYEFNLSCGIPRVTLEGEKSDWETILLRLEKLKEYGVQAVAWYHLLFPVVSRFVKAFDDPDGKENIDFWQRVAHYNGGGSGPTWLSGWITAFCVFDKEGRWLGNALGEVPEDFSGDMASLSAEEFWSIFDAAPPSREYFKLDGSRYHDVDTDKIPPGFAEVDVKLDDNGEIFDTILTAGLVGSRVSSSSDKRLSSTGENDTIRPVVGWWMFIVKA